MSTNALKTNQDLFTESEVDFGKTLGKLLYLDKKEVPDYQSIVINSETGEVIAGALVNDETGRLVDGTVPEGVQAEVRSRPIDGTCVAYDVVVEAEGFGNQLEVTVPTAVSLDGLAYNQEIRFTGLSARHWSRTTRQLTNGRVSFVHTQGFKLRAENVEAVKVKADKK